MTSSFDVDNSFSNFYNTLSGFVYKHAPLKILSKCNLKQFSKPWLSSEKFWISNLRVVVKSRVCIPYLMATAFLKLKGVGYPYVPGTISSTNQIILQRITSFATRTMIRHTHELTGHLGREHIFSKVREKFCIPQI